MATWEDLMAGLFEGTAARGAQGLGNVAPANDRDPRRRRAGRGSGYEGLAGGSASLMDMLPHLQGIRGYDYSGPMLRGLQDMIPGRMQDITGPARRHLERQGGAGRFDQPMDFPPGLMRGQGPGDNRNPLGGPNVAPGNLDTGFSVGQPPGIGPAAPHSQGWRNVAPGYSAAAGLGYGTPEFEARMRGQFPGPSGRPVAPGGGGGPDNRQAPGSRGGGGTSGGGAPTGQGGRRVGGGPAPSAPSPSGNAPGVRGGRDGGRGPVATAGPAKQPSQRRIDARRGGRTEPSAPGAENKRPNAPGVRTGRQPGRGPNMSGKDVEIQQDRGRMVDKLTQGRYANETPAQKKARLAAKAERKQAKAERASRIQDRRNEATYGTPDAPADPDSFSGLRRPAETPTAGKTRPAGTNTNRRRNLLK